eukprot:scaffold3942_cov123-Isochrysis_galbana.AAC.15
MDGRIPSAAIISHARLARCRRSAESFSDRAPSATWIRPPETRRRGVASAAEALRRPAAPATPWLSDKPPSPIGRCTDEQAPRAPGYTRALPPPVQPPRPSVPQSAFNPTPTHLARLQFNLIDDLVSGGHVAPAGHAV